MGGPEVEESKIPASAAKISPFSTNKQLEQPKAVNNPEFKASEPQEALKK